MERLDYRNPFLSATIVTPDGERYPMWLRTPASAQASARLGKTNSLAFVTEVSVELQLAYLPIIKATITPPYRNAIDFLNSRLIEWGQSILEVQFGYVVQQARDPNDPSRPAGRAILSPVYSGVLLKPDVTLGESTIVLNAQGVGGFAAVRQEGGLTVSATRKEVVQKLFERFGVAVDDAEVLKLSTSQAGVVAEWSKTTINFVQGGDTYWTAAMKVIREAGCHAYLSGNKLLILPASFVFSSTPTKLFRYYDFAGGRIGPVDGGATGINRVLPILSASSPTSAIYLPGSAQGFFIKDVNSFDREEIKKFVGDKQVAAPRTGEGASSIANSKTLPAADKQTGEGAEQFPGDPSDSQVVQQVKAEYAAQSTLMGVALNFDSVGDPSVMPGQVCAVRGLGERLSGNYSIFKLTHTIGGSGYTMSIESVSNVAQALKNAVTALGPVSKEPTVDERVDATPGGLTIDAEKLK